MQAPDTTPTEDLMVSLSNAIAKGLEPLDEILMRHNVSRAHFSELEKNPRFHAMVVMAAREWGEADNVGKRNELKSSMMFEECLPEFMTRLHDKNESLAAKVEFMKLLAKVGKLGAPDRIAGGGETFKLTINLGADQQLNIEKMLPSRVIESDDYMDGYDG